MKVATFLVFLVVLCIHDAQSRPRISSTADQIEDTLKRVPADEQVNFLKYHLSLGYDLHANANNWPDNITSDFAVALFKYAMSSHQITDPLELRAARNIVCFPDGTCIDLGDIGVHP
ncbi:uncharacterized protein [Atheta coriaria]|uniref:uncharacterized protein n=1 Tax=Dalotia coriaria TaxID=877792 RepID=UPI0031F44D70